jgi:hypothetical protein
MKVLDSEVEFKEEDGFISVWYEDDRAPFEDKIMGTLRKDDEGFYRFHPGKVVMTCKHCRMVMYQLSVLNT